jgi:hypothetical protein
MPYLEERYGGVVVLELEPGSGGFCSTRHRTPVDSMIEGYKYVG